jgi:hypothetical protein
VPDLSEVETQVAHGRFTTVISTCPGAAMPGGSVADGAITSCDCLWTWAACLPDARLGRSR